MYAVCLINLVNTCGLPFAELELSQYKAHFTLQKHSLVMYLFCCMGEISHQAPQIQEALWKYTDMHHITSSVEKHDFSWRKLVPLNSGERRRWRRHFYIHFSFTRRPKGHWTSKRPTGCPVGFWVSAQLVNRCPWRCSTSAHVPRHATATSCRACSRSVSWLQIFKVEAFTSRLLFRIAEAAPEAALHQNSSLTLQAIASWRIIEGCSCRVESGEGCFVCCDSTLPAIVNRVNGKPDMTPTWIS